MKQQHTEHLAGLDYRHLDVRQLWGITGLIWALIALFHYMQFYFQHVQRGNTFPWIATLAEFIVNYSAWVPIAAFVIWLGRRFGFKKDDWVRPLIVHLIVCIVIATTHIGLVAAMLQAIKGPLYGFSGYSDYFIYCFLWLFHFEFLIYWMVLGLSYGFNYYSAQLRRHNQSPYLDRLVIKCDGQTVLLNTSKIDWLEAADNYVKVHTRGLYYLMRERMHVLEKKLNPDNFQRIHRSLIVNISRIQTLERGKSGEWTVQLKNGQRLQVSRRRKEHLQKSLDHLA